MPDNCKPTLATQLTAVGAGMPVELLIEAVLWPKHQIKEGYTATTLTTKDGKVIGGYVDTENKQRIVIRDAATGTTQAIATGKSPPTKTRLADATWPHRRPEPRRFARPDPLSSRTERAVIS